ncbi:ubiquinol-cytochrome c reductase core subunit 1 [Rhizophlyctis rosea]|uniref:Cytochrome b-c1 complex subunit 2, mitochondrial n=1 Tax=Rhizophlyctis rosea TaxID=64517 RepID=A0AAD5X4I4_9FUNG|nr:ubiquinol-cytochrome c reductase core subunit 1 [Rhizophlyctis rosea]
MLPTTRAATRPILRAASQLQSRSYAVLTEAYSPLGYRRTGDQPDVAPLAEKSVSKASNGIHIATYDEQSPVSTLAVVVKAGSRYESADAPGTAQFVKNTIFRTVPGDNIVRSLRTAELRGNTIYSSVDREHLVIASDFLRDDLVDAVPTLLTHVFNETLAAHEFMDARKTTAKESAGNLADPNVKVFEALHEIAFRTGLGNPVYAPPAAAKSLKTAKLAEFTKKVISSDRVAIVGSGISHEDLTKLVESAFQYVKVPAAKGAAADSTSKYFGGEARIDAGPKGESHYVVAFPSVSASSPDYPAALVLKSLLDTSNRFKWGSPAGVSGLLASAATQSTSVSAFNASYSDAGLIGFHVQGEAGEVKGVASKALGALKGLANGVGEEALKGAKKRVIVDADVAGARDVKVQEVARRLFAKGDVATPKEFAEAVQKVSAADVQKLAKSLLSGKPSAVAYGNVRKLPYVDEL